MAYTNHCIVFDLKDEITLTDAANDTGLKCRWNQCWVLLGAGTTFDWFHVEGIVVASQTGQHLTLLDTGGMIKVVVDDCGEKGCWKEENKIKLLCSVNIYKLSIGMVKY